MATYGIVPSFLQNGHTVGSSYRCHFEECSGRFTSISKLRSIKKDSNHNCLFSHLARAESSSSCISIQKSYSFRSLAYGSTQSHSSTVFVPVTSPGPTSLAMKPSLSDLCLFLKGYLELHHQHQALNITATSLLTCNASSGKTPPLSQSHY